MSSQVALTSHRLWHIKRGGPDRVVGYIHINEGFLLWALRPYISMYKVDVTERLVALFIGISEANGESDSRDLEQNEKVAIGKAKSKAVATRIICNGCSEMNSSLTLDVVVSLVERRPTPLALCTVCIMRFNCTT